MAGRKQHFIPQALQRGFVAAKGKKRQVYVFKKGHEPYYSSTEGVAAQRDFYSAPSDEQSLDDKITIYEGAVLAPAIAALREAPTGPIDSHVAAAVVVHLSIRTAFVRGSFSVAATEMLDYFADAMRSDQTARALLEVDTLKSESMLVKLIEEEILLQFDALPESSRNALAKLVHFRAREKFPQMFPGLAAMVLQQFGMLLEKIPEMIVSGHSKALERDLAPVLRVERLKAMNWQIIAAEPSTHFVLPDCLAVGSKTSNFQEIMPYSLLSDDELAGVVMPVCSDKVLVGCFGNPELNPASLNRCFAKCSLDFIISSQADAQTAEAANLIGITVSKYVDSLVEEQAFSAPEKSGSNGESPETKDGVLEPDPGRVPIKFEPSSRMSSKAQATVRKLMSAPELQMGLRTVEAIVVSDNIVRSLRQRGVTLNEHAAQVVKLGTCHTTETPDGVSSQLFITTESVNQVTKGRPQARAAAALIRHQAGRATYYATVVARIPKETLQRQRPQLEAIGLRTAHFFCSHYFGGRLSGGSLVSDEEFAIVDGVYSQVLAGCVQGIASARLHFFEHRDVDVALGLALGHVEQLLCATANACATTCSKIDRWKTSKSIKALQAVSLGEWFELLALDLERFFDSRENLTGDSDLILLGGHIERVLWSFGIVLSMQTAEQLWMEVFAEEQLENMRLMLRG
ncbi:DUF4238 domain-containing protein [Comamonas aquatica]|uniref:DUF4238 domain-containing protein n=1 Tax=Comamonas aquatica TaxID=225991 RepID=UPI00244A82C9|nr:DUF4238 domain-containing protein [Comamonas aquatica]MDH1675021.1 DUF4238 domain-containing protein [Comamonas aquatica]MDH1678687.1 DUF4238 domain-containing protein [Comamonas aquatica]